jgi:uncharacterized protein YheU (UPF0270 family)
MSQFVEVPSAQLDSDTLRALLEEYASRDGTDYGEREMTLWAKVDDLRLQLETGKLLLLYDADSETWDLVEREQATQLLHD